MKRTIIALLTLLPLTATAQDILTADKIRIDSHQLTRTDKGELYVSIDYTLTDKLNFSSNRMLTLTPIICKDTTAQSENKALAPSVYYGRKRMIIQERQQTKTFLDAVKIDRRKNNTEQSNSQTAVIDMQPWMEECQLMLHAELCGCGNAKEEELLIPVGRILRPFPTYDHIAFLTPVAPPVKVDSLKGSAYLDYRVNRTELDPTYRRNPQELDSIRATIAPVRSDNNVSITYATIKGYASPEGSYQNNVRLASGRAETMRKYIVEEYALEGIDFKVSYEPEDWEGLRRHILEGSLPQKDQILSIIDDKTIKSPDARDNRLKQLACYKKDILEDIYPALRHSDYTIYYTIRDFTTEEAKEIFKTRPAQLSQAEMYRVAQTYEPGSADYNKLFMTAVTMFPDDEAANLNAAAIALQQKDLAQAERYLKKAGDSPQAKCNKALLKWMQGDKQQAYAMMKQAADAGCKEAQLALKEMEKRSLP